MNIRFLPINIAALLLIVSIMALAPSQASAYYGDVDFDGTIRMVDAINVLRYLAGLEYFDAGKLSACDINHDFSCNAYDCLYITKTALDPSFVPPRPPPPPIW